MFLSGPLPQPTQGSGPGEAVSQACLPFYTPGPRDDPSTPPTLGLQTRLTLGVGGAESPSLKTRVMNLFLAFPAVIAIAMVTARAPVGRMPRGAKGHGRCSLVGT